MSRYTNAGVIGAGAWGTALAVVAARAGLAVTLWARSGEQADAIEEARENTTYLPGIALPPAVACTADAGRLASCDLVLIATPAQHLGAVMGRVGGGLRPGTAGLICAKGIERGTNRLMSQVLAEAAPHLVPMVLTGPSFARDVAMGLPTAVTLAGLPEADLAGIAQALSLPTFRIYTGHDPVGAQIGGAVKNVLAIACGISDGKGLGESSRAALITRAFAELTRFGRALGADPATLAGLSGLGDLILTCSSGQSRNHSLGHALGRGRALADILAERRSVSEGVHSAAAVMATAAGLGIEMPVCEAVDAIVAGRSDPDREIARLLSRPLRTETD